MNGGIQMRRTVTSESVTSGHPDKVCDQISDNILDRVLEQDPLARVACEVAINNRILIIMGEITTTAYVDYASEAKDVLHKLGYWNILDPHSLANIQIIVSINEQAPDIARGVNLLGGLEHHEGLGAGDQGLMIGYACNETKAFMPLPITLAHALTKRLEEVRSEGIIPYLKPDGKAQVSLIYEDDVPIRVETIVVSAQHKESATWKEINKDIYKHVIKAVIPAQMLTKETKILINPTGRFVIGGPEGDSGLTGRKIIVDTYGGIGRHGGGAFSGKDPSKVDRSGAYMARYIAKNIVAAGLATKCEVEMAFAIGQAQPVALNIHTFGTGLLSDSDFALLIRKTVGLGVSDIIERFNLQRPIYSNTAAYGHFGKEDLPWEAMDLTEVLKIKTKNWNKTYEQWFKDLTLEHIEEVHDIELLDYVMVRPGHPDQYGFLTPGYLMVHDDEASEKIAFLIKRLSEIPKEAKRAAINRRIKQ